MDNEDLIINIGAETLTIDAYTTTTVNTGDITLSTGNTSLYDGNTWVDISSLTTDTIDLSNLTITLDNPIEFEDTMPDVSIVEYMCNEYPALAKLYENFKRIYKMVHQVWVCKQKENVSTF